METIAVFPLKRSFRDMNAAAFILLSIAAVLQLPDYYSLLLRKEHRVAFLDVKGIEELLEVAQSSIYAILSQRVNVLLCEAFLFFIIDILAPNVGIAEEETLLCGETVNCLRTFATERIHEGRV